MFSTLEQFDSQLPLLLHILLHMRKLLDQVIKIVEQANTEFRHRRFTYALSVIPRWVAALFRINKLQSTGKVLITKVTPKFVLDMFTTIPPMGSCVLRNIWNFSIVAWKPLVGEGNCETVVTMLTS